MRSKLDELQQRRRALSPTQEHVQRIKRDFINEETPELQQIFERVIGFEVLERAAEAIIGGYSVKYGPVHVVSKPHRRDDLEQRMAAAEADILFLKDRAAYEQAAPERERKQDLERLGELTRIVKALAQEYDLDASGAVVMHFLARANLLPLLLNAVEPLRQSFGDTRAMLRCEEGELVLGIPTTLDPDEAEELFSKFLREWWMPNAGVVDRMTVTLDYV